MKIGIINYGAGNLASVINTIDKLGYKTEIIRQPEQLYSIDKIIIPGVGHAGKAMQNLNESGLANALKSTQKPTLGICLGMQLMGNFSDEGNTECLGIMNFDVMKLDISLKTPHMGWNRIKVSQNPLFTGIPNNTWFYFVHSFYVAQNKLSIAECDYEKSICAAVNLDNFWGVQFHPEKSGEYGIQIIKNFIELCE
ncbi:MAG: imidazole glycerol phosphate synthase subunit HisH [Bacteroidales bacterium]